MYCVCTVCICLCVDLFHYVLTCDIWQVVYVCLVQSSVGHSSVFVYKKVTFHDILTVECNNVDMQDLFASI